MSAEAIEGLIVAQLATLAEGRSLDPMAIARQVAGPDEKVWRLLMAPIRETAVRLALDGRATILRKGKPTDPRAFKGLYRIGRA